ncbi:FliM/FliN family flagellar motor switch protein [Brucella sp. IR073]|uniref:FliM/FliN family flagellar motor switch protein n=1 Tax=unclassified Brucella TaxID=2632610 RepID=UPI003B986FA1
MAIDVSVLPQLSADIGRALNRIAGTYWSLGLASSKTDGLVLQLDVAFGQRPAALKTATALSVKCSFASFGLTVETKLIDVLGEQLFPAWFTEGGRTLPDEWRAILVLNKLASQTGLEANIFTLEPDGAADLPPGNGRKLLHGLIHFEGAAYKFTIAVKNIYDVLPGAAGSLHCSQMTNGFDPGFPCRVYLPAKRLASSAYSRLRPGDVVLLVQEDGGSIPFQARIPEILHLSGTLPAGTSSRPIRALIEKVEKSRIMTNNDTEIFPEESSSEEFEQISPALLPVTLEVSLGSHRLTLQQLQRLAPGSTLELDIDLSAPVTISANGAPVGQGHLIRIGDRVGVQLVEWPTMKARRGA